MTERSTARRVASYTFFTVLSVLFWVGVFTHTVTTLTVFALLVTAPLVFTRRSR